MISGVLLAVHLCTSSTHLPQERGLQSNLVLDDSSPLARGISICLCSNSVRLLRCLRQPTRSACAAAAAA